MFKSFKDAFVEKYGFWKPIEKVKGSCYYTTRNLTSLEAVAEFVGCNFYCSHHNSVKFTEDGVLLYFKIKGDVYV